MQSCQVSELYPFRRLEVYASVWSRVVRSSIELMSKWTICLSLIRMISNAVVKTMVKMEQLIVIPFSCLCQPVEISWVV